MAIPLIAGAGATVIIFRFTAWDKTVTLNNWAGWVVFGFMMLGGVTLAQILADAFRVIAR